MTGGSFMDMREKITDDSLLSAGLDGELAQLSEAIETIQRMRDNIKVRDALKTIALRAVEEGNIRDAKIALNIL
jgi:hypothetical protein